MCSRIPYGTKVCYEHPKTYKDANAIADHKAAIDEREYWRKLRGEIFLKAMEKYDFTHSGAVDSALSRSKYIVNKLYDQDKDFLKDKRL